MKNKRTIIIAALLVLALCLGIGYADLTREMVISSTANLDPNNNAFKIVLIKAEVEDGKASVATASVTGGGSTANYTVTGLTQPGDSVKITFTIENQTADVDATMVSLSKTPGTVTITAADGSTTDGISADTWFDKEIVIKDSTGTEVPDGNSFTIAPGAQATVEITVTLKNTVVNSTKLTGATVSLHFNGTATNPNP